MAAAVAVMGIPLSAAISPLVLAVATIVVDLAWRIFTTPDLLAPFRNLLNDQPVTNVVGLVVAATVALLASGAVVLTLCWLRTRGLFREAGIGGGGRRPRRPPAPCRRSRRAPVANVVAEIALAGGLHPPEVRIIYSR